MRSLTRLLSSLCFLLLAWPATAHAGRLVVLQFDGAGPAAQARLSLVRPLLRVEGLTLVPQADYASQAESVGVTANELATPSGVRRGAAVAAVDAVIAGTTVRRGRAWDLRLSFYDADGTRRLQRNYPLVNGEFRSSDLDRIVAYVQERVASPEVATTAAGQDASPDPEPSGAPAGSATSEQQGGASWSPSPDPDGPESGRHIEGADEEGSDGRGRRPTSEFGGPSWVNERAGGAGRSPGPMLSVVVTGGGANRRYYMEGPNTSITYETTKPASGNGVALFPELGVLVESFPVRDGGVLTEGLGLEAGVSRGFVASHFMVGETVTPVETPVYRTHLDARWSYRILQSSAFSPAFGLRAGFGFSDFRATVHNAAFTGVRHYALRLGAEAVQPLLAPFLRLQAAFMVMPAAFPGETEKRAYGEEVSASGWVWRIGLAGRLRDEGAGPAWALNLEKQYIATDFAGTGTRDDGGSSEESYLAIHAGIGFSY